MEMQITQKGAYYTADCARCGSTIQCHEWSTCNNNDMRDAMQQGLACCGICGGNADPDTFAEHKPRRGWYAGRYSMPGYLDCTEWHYDTNYRRLVATLRDYYKG